MKCKCACIQGYNDSCTDAIFPKVEDWLEEDSDRSKSYFFMESLADPDDYRDTMDWLFCSIFPHEREACFAFYNDEGEPLRNIISEARRVFYEHILLSVLRQLYRRYTRWCEDRWENMQDHDIKSIAKKAIDNARINSRVLPGKRKGRTKFADDL